MSTAITRMAAKPRRSCHAKLVCSQSAAHSVALTGSVQASRLGAHAADVAHALQIKRECKRRADNGDLQRAERHRGVERDRNPPRLREHEQHTPPMNIPQPVQTLTG